MWWTISTLTTQGCDMHPVTTLGRLLGVAIALAGIGMFAIPAGILSNAFYDRSHRDNPCTYCPHCGKRLQ